MKLSPSWEAASRSATQMFSPTFYGTRMSITVFKTARHFSLSWVKLIHSISSHPISLKTHFNIILRPTCRYSQNFQDYPLFIILTLLSGGYIIEFLLCTLSDTLKRIPRCERSSVWIVTQCNTKHPTHCTDTFTSWSTRTARKLESWNEIF
jgi:hypothetical protein